MNTKQKKQSVNFISLGCPKNLVDSEVMMGMLQNQGFQVESPDNASDITIINTCSFIEESRQESIDTILEIAKEKKTNPNKKIIVAGCLAQRYPKELPKLLPEVDFFIGSGDYNKIPELLIQEKQNQFEKTYVNEPKFLPDHLTPRTQSTPFYTKYVKISEGCSHRCSFCIIPTLRGNTARSRTVESIVSEIKNGVESGVKEFNLVAQDLNEYGRDLKQRTSLYELLKATENLSGNFWLRLLYMYPLQFPDKLIDLIANHPHITKYVDIPLQHISEKMLKIMNRGSSSRYIYRLLNQLRKKIPDIVLRTTFIVGHPGETAQDFAELKSFIQDMEFDRVGFFKYSKEENTPSFLLKENVVTATKNKRQKELAAVQRKISLKKNKALVGKTLRGIFTGKSTNSDFFYAARYAGQAPDIDGEILVRSGLAPVGDFCDIKIVEAHEYDLIGEVVSKHDALVNAPNVFSV